tara:strand:- start:569 stop:3769 length:3201 start_codon:yes stop_codon:yes gene_type:complete
MGLLGKSFRDFVGTQVKKRQEALGEHSSRFSTVNKTKSFLTNTPWIRLASSVNINPQNFVEEDTREGVYEQLEKSELFGDDLNKFTGSQLAKEFVLFGGVNNHKGGIDNSYSGLNSPNSTTQLFGGAYGFGSWDQLFSNNGEGYKPMPGITNMDFSYKNDGALSQATVTVKAFSRSQFQIIDVLFQRPGYTVLLEYGHSTFLDDRGEIQHAGEGEYSYQTLPFKELFNDKNNTEELSHYTLSSKIFKEKENWHGNYEGAFMKIAKFNWKYNIDGSYDITVNLIGIGDVISSLKTNVIPITRQKENQDDKKEAINDGNFLVGNSKSSKINEELFNIWKKTKNDLPLWANINPVTGLLGLASAIWKNYISEEVTITDGAIEDFPFPIKEIDSEGNELIKDFKKKTKLKIPNGVLLLENTDNDKGIDGYDDFCYITFGYLISLLTKHVNLKSNKDVPYIYYDFNYQEIDGEENIVELKDDKNFLATYSGNMSSNPSNILIPFKKLDDTILKELNSDIREKYNTFIEKGENEILDVLNEKNKDFFVDGNPNIGRLDRVYLDVNYIAKVLNDNTNINKLQEGECNLIDVLKQILEEINGSLGGINEFRIIFNQETQLITFVSESPITSESENDDELIVLNTMGLESLGDGYKGSFVKGIDLKAELNDDFATMISIGSQSDGNRLQGNGGAFSQYNRGLTDRIIPEKKDSQDDGKGNKKGNEKGEDGVKDKDEKISLIDSIITEEFIDAVEEIYDDFNFKREYIDIIKAYNTSLSPMVIGELELVGAYPTPFFLPFNLGLTLHGLGGIRIYDGFKVDGKMLPPSYDPSQISLIIKSLSHSVNLDGWVTKIETLPKPLFKKKVIKLPPLPLSWSTPPNQDGNTLKSTSPTLEEPIPPTNNPTASERFEAIKESFNEVFSKQGEKSGMCSRWSYNLALNYCRSLKSNPSIPGRQLPAGGNANQNLQYFRNLIKLGYTQTKAGSNISKNKCISLVKNTQWGYGDVIVYYATEGNPSQSHVRYGHTQIYVGNLSSSAWSTSKKTNYGGGFIYKTRNSDKWDFYVFRAPENASQVKL